MGRIAAAWGRADECRRRCRHACVGEAAAQVFFCPPWLLWWCVST